MDKLFCNGTELKLQDYSNRVNYFPHQHLYTAALTLMLFVIALVPQCFLLMTCSRRQLIHFSCYKLMFIICILDMINLVNCALIRSLLTFFNVQHCTSGMWVIYYGHMTLFFWWAYCVANVILAINRLLEFLSSRLTKFFFAGYRTWIWLNLILLYAVVLEVLSPRRFYFYDPVEGKWHFQFLDQDDREILNYVLLYNNIAKIVIIVVCYTTLMALLHRKLKLTVGGNNDMQTKLSIQACILAVACILGSMTPIIMAYWPIQNFPFNSFISNIMWISQHSAAGFVYALMNHQVKRTITGFLHKVVNKKRLNVIVSTLQFDRTNQS